MVKPHASFPPVARTLLLLTLPLWLLALGACSSRPAGGEDGGFNRPLYLPAHARGFRILGAQGKQSIMIETKAPWQGADSTAVTRLLILRGREQVPQGFKGQVLRGEAAKVVCMSSSYIAMLDAAGAVDRVAGVSGMGFVTNPHALARKEHIKDVGYDGNTDYEALLAIGADLVLLYGVNGASVLEPKLRELNIPYMYVGEYLEQDPLGKAEWMVPLGYTVGRGREASQVFTRIPARYERICRFAATASTRPKVMINTPYRDSWVMASTDSYVARLIRDAGGDYVYKKNTSGESMPVDMEEAYSLAAQADVWINTGQFTSLDAIKHSWPKFADVPAVRSGQVWNSTLRSTPAGGNDYWEGGVVNPDLVLLDLIQIFHPELVQDARFTYYQRLTP